jgi:hypothetical protein
MLEKIGKYGKRQMEHLEDDIRFIKTYFIGGSLFHLRVLTVPNPGRIWMMIMERFVLREK